MVKNMKPQKIFAEYIEHTALQQFNEAMAQDYVVKGALMPDAHTGYSLPIGGVVATKGVVVPAYVGYDIGCGVCAIQTTFDVWAVLQRANEIFDKIYEVVPVGRNTHSKATKTKLDPTKLTKDAQKIFSKRGGFHQLGTLGGGNHFIELGADEMDRVWIIIHSGSRGIGHGIADYYMRVASGGKKVEGHFPLDDLSVNGVKYINDMNWCLDYALENRKVILKLVIDAVSELIGGEGKWDTLINRNHNHADKKDGLWIHRKGATHAEEGMLGVVPGNMRDGSFIVEGKGNEDALCSSSHGAGRVYGRKKAKEVLTVSDFEKQMVGVKALVGYNTLDESPGAYKNIFDVMKLQEDLVDVWHHVKPLINIKG